MAAEPLTSRLPLAHSTSLRLWAGLPHCVPVCVCAILCLSHMMLLLGLLTRMMSPPREASLVTGHSPVYTMDHPQ